MVSLADWDASLCHRADFETAEWADPVRDLLLDAAEECA
jgi:hypothetical protein